MKRARSYGKLVQNVKPETHLIVGHILGGTLTWSDNGQPDGVLFQAMKDDKLQRVDFSFRDAMFLLSFLRAVQLDTGFPMPDDPRGKNKKTPDAGAH